MVAPINYMGVYGDQSGNPLLEGLQAGALIKNSRDAAKAKADAEVMQQQYSADLQNALQNPTAKGFAELTLKYPQQREAFKQSWEALGKDQQDKEFLVGAQAFNALDSNNVDVAKKLITEQITASENSGQPTDKYKAMLATLDSDPKLVKAQLGLILSSVAPEKWSKSAEENRDATLFPVLQKQKQVELSKASSQAQTAAIEAKYADRFAQAQLKKAEREVQDQIKGADSVQSSAIKPDGTTVIVTKSGQTRVIGADGVELVGQARVDAVRDAEQFGADIQALRSGSRKGGEIGQVEAQKAFTSVGKIRQNISNLDAAIAALDAGANSGVIASKFPNWKASSIELQNIQRQLGLDVIGSVAFGALSEGELSLALETALPLNMQEKDLKNWLTNKKDAQLKLSNYLSDQARFLSVPGRTIGDWLERSGQTGNAGTTARTPPTGTQSPNSVTVQGQTYTKPSNFSDIQWNAYKKAMGVQ